MTKRTQPRFRYRFAVSGAKTAVMMAPAASTHAI